MKGKVSVFLMVSLVVSLCALTILAQAEEKKAQLFWVNEVVVYPSMVQEFEEAVKAQVAFFTKHKCPFPYYTYSTYDYHYIVMIAIKNYAEIDDIHKAFSEISKLAPDEYQKMEEMFTETYEYARSGVYSLNYDLSLFPEEEKEKAGEENF
nr:hypothetical protein [bacterium]